MTSLTALLSAAAALGGVLALAGSWGRGIRPGTLPHLSVGAVAGVGSAVALQLPRVPVPVTWLAAAAAGALCGAALHQAGHAPPRPNREVPVGGDIVTLAALLGVAALLAPPGPGLGARTLLGGQWPPADGSALAASLVILVLGAGLAAALALVPAPVLSLRGRSVLAGAGTAALAAAAAQGAAAAQAYARPEPLTLALAVAVVAALGRTPLRAAGSGVAAGAVLALCAALSVPPPVVVALSVLGLTSLAAARAGRVGKAAAT